MEPHFSFLDSRFPRGFARGRGLLWVLATLSLVAADLPSLHAAAVVDVAYSHRQTTGGWNPPEDDEGSTTGVSRKLTLLK